MGSATFARTRGIMRLTAPTRKKNIHRALTPKEKIPIAQRKQNSNCYHCGQAGHWAAQCPIKDIPAFDPEFWEYLDKFQELEPNNKIKIEVP